MATIGKHILTLGVGDVGSTVNDGAGLTVKSVHVLGDASTIPGHQYRIEDPFGNLLYRSQASGAWYESESITQRRWYDGIKVVALDSGVIDIDYEILGETKY